jgi:hypothetical protein
LRKALVVLHQLRQVLAQQHTQSWMNK